MLVKIKKLHKDAIIPKYATAGSACFDLTALNHGWVDAEDKKIFSTGLSFEIPEGYVMHIYPRSGLAINKGIRLSNNVAVIDSDYRGEVLIALYNDTFTAHQVNAGDRIAQAMIVPVQQVQFEEVEALSKTERGLGGLGSTGN